MPVQLTVNDKNDIKNLLLQLMEVLSQQQVMSQIFQILRPHKTRFVKNTQLYETLQVLKNKLVSDQHQNQIINKYRSHLQKQQFANYVNKSTLSTSDRVQLLNDLLTILSINNVSELILYDTNNEDTDILIGSLQPSGHADAQQYMEELNRRINTIIQQIQDIKHVQMSRNQYILSGIQRMQQLGAIQIIENLFNKVYNQNQNQQVQR